MSKINPSTPYTREQVAKHNKASDCWIIINGKVYDVSKFLFSHPGGPLPILPYAGKDATAEFAANHLAETLKKYESKLQVGVVAEGPLNSTNTPASPALASNSKATPLKSVPKALDAATPMRPPTAGDAELQNYPHSVLSTSAKIRSASAEQKSAKRASGVGSSVDKTAPAATQTPSPPAPVAVATTKVTKIDPYNPDPPGGVPPVPASQPLQLRDMYGVLRLKKIEAISTGFYTRVYSDEKTPWLPKMFEGVPLDLAINKQVSFFVQQWGGNEWFGSMKKDDEFMQQVHSDFRITPNALQRWMEHMRASIEEVVVEPEVPRANEVRAVLFDWFWQFGNRTVNTLNNDPRAPQNAKEGDAPHNPHNPHNAHKSVTTTPAQPKISSSTSDKQKKEKKPKKEKREKKEKKQKKEKSEKKVSETKSKETA